MTTNEEIPCVPKYDIWLHFIDGGNPEPGKKRSRIEPYIVKVASRVGEETAKQLKLRIQEFMLPGSYIYYEVRESRFAHLIPEEIIGTVLATKEEECAARVQRAAKGLQQAIDDCFANDMNVRMRPGKQLEEYFFGENADSLSDYMDIIREYL